MGLRVREVVKVVPYAAVPVGLTILAYAAGSEVGSRITQYSMEDRVYQLSDYVLRNARNLSPQEAAQSMGGLFAGMAFVVTSAASILHLNRRNSMDRS